MRFFPEKSEQDRNMINFALDIVKLVGRDAPQAGTAVRLHVYLVFVKSIEQELKIQ